MYICTRQIKQNKLNIKETNIYIGLLINIIFGGRRNGQVCEHRYTEVRVLQLDGMYKSRLT